MIKRPITLNSKNAPGKCMICSKDATTEVLEELEGVQVLERYCDLCLPLKES